MFVSSPSVPKGSSDVPRNVKYVLEGNNVSSFVGRFSSFTFGSALSTTQVITTTLLEMPVESATLYS